MFLKIKVKTIRNTAILLILIGTLLCAFFLAKSLSKSSEKSKNYPKSFDSYSKQVGGVKDRASKSQDLNEDPSSSFNLQYQKQPRNTVRVVRVIDGDTIEIEGGQKVRYIGINSPETVDPRRQEQCFGKEAVAKNRQLLEGNEVFLEKDVSETDKYGRLLRYIYLGELFVNDFLVSEGFAYASSFPPDVKYQDQLAQAQRDAQENNRGLWSSCQNQHQYPPDKNEHECQIKGNISSSGEKIYHMPDQKYWDKTVIDESRGERWFCLEDEAISAGWRKSKI